MLAMASASNQTEAVVKIPSSPTPALVPPSSPQLQDAPLWAAGPKGHSYEELQKSSFYASAALNTSYGGSISMQLSELNFLLLQQHNKHAKGLYTDHATLMQHPTTFEQQQQRWMQIRQMMQVVAPQQHAPQPSINRASAA